jgi:hypothetical protein
MKEYFNLQATLINRRIRDAGVVPLFAYIILILGFYSLSAYLFNVTEFAVYIYPFLYINLIGRLSETRRCEFLTICFGDNQFKKIRIAENLNLDITECVNGAYNVIKNRTGITKNGTFIKD